MREPYSGPLGLGGADESLLMFDDTKPISLFSPTCTTSTVPDRPPSTYSSNNYNNLNFIPKIL